jgi:hypothetical protein
LAHPKIAIAPDRGDLPRFEETLALLRPLLGAGARETHDNDGFTNERDFIEQLEFSVAIPSVGCLNVAACCSLGHLTGVAFPILPVRVWLTSPQTDFSLAVRPFST